MSSIPRLNGAIRAFETGNIAFTAFCPPDTGSAQAIAAAPYDAVVIEMEHNPFDVKGLRDCLQYMLDPRRIAAAGHVAPPGNADGAPAVQWCGNEPVDGQAGPRYGGLRHHLAAHPHR